MNNKTINNIVISPQTIDEEFEYLMKILDEMDFFNQYGYKVALPNHPFFLNLSKNTDLLKSLNVKEVKNIFKKEVYDLNFFENGLKVISKNLKSVERAIKEMKKWKKWKFKIFNEYKIKLTAYGPGGSYFFKKGVILMKVNKKGEFIENPYHTIIHEIIHIGIEKTIVKKFKLTHIEKEVLVDTICIKCFDELLPEYEIQNLGNKKMFNFINKDNIMNLPYIIKEFKKLQKTQNINIK